MDIHHPAHKRRILSLAAALLIFGLGCLCMPAGLIATPTPTPAPPEPPTRTVVPPVIPTPTFSPLPPLPFPPTRTPDSGLNAQGPWLLIETSQGLWAVNPDGSGLARLASTDFWRGNLEAAVQPRGDLIAAISPGDFSFKHLTLNLVSPANRKANDKGKQIPLTSPQTEAYTNSGPGDPGFEALRAIGEMQSYAWSPDGSRIAFVGAMDGPSADMYIYDLAADQITRVSTDPDQDFWPSWSPDGKHLLYLEAKGFGTGAGMVMAGVWDFPIDAAEPVLLYRPTGSGDMIAGWLNDTTVLLASSIITCGPEKLRLYDVVTRQETMLNEGCFTSASATAFRSAVLFSNDSGIYMLTDEARTPVQVSPEKNAYISRWGPDDYVFKVTFSDGRVATFGPGTYDNQVSPVTEPTSSPLLFDTQDVAMYGAIWGWTSTNELQPGAWITGPGVDFGRIFEGAARFPAWSPHNDLLFFAPLEGGYDLYITTFDAHYSNLHVVNHLDADITGVVWLGEK